MHFMLYTPLSSNCLSLFFKNSFPPSLGSMILKTALRQNHANNNNLLRPSNRTDYTHSGGVYGAWNLQNRLEMCISCLWTLFGVFVCHYMFYRMYFGWQFRIFAMLSSSFCWKLDPALGSHIAQIFKANTACKICRIHVAMMSSSWSRRLWIAYCLEDMSYTCRHDVFILE